MTRFFKFRKSINPLVKYIISLVTFQQATGTQTRVSCILWVILRNMRPHSAKMQLIRNSLLLANKQKLFQMALVSRKFHY